MFSELPWKNADVLTLGGSQTRACEFKASTKFKDKYWQAGAWANYLQCKHWHKFTTAALSTSLD